MPHLESKTKLIMTASVNKYINPLIKIKQYEKNLIFEPCARIAYGMY